MMYEIHPLLAHIPTGFFLISGILGIAGIFIQRNIIQVMLLILMAGGLVFLLPTIYTGLKAEETAFIYGEMQYVLSDHTRAAYVMLIMFLTALLWLIFRRKEMKNSEYIIFVIFLLFSCSTVIFEALTGNKLTYQYGIHVKKPPIEESEGGNQPD